MQPRSQGIFPGIFIHELHLSVLFGYKKAEKDHGKEVNINLNQTINQTINVFIKHFFAFFFTHCYIEVEFSLAREHFKY